MDDILVSIIVPCYNQAKYIQETLDSIANQHYKNWECIIVDDGSKDNTAEIVKKYTDTDSRFVYYFKANGGVSSARNYAIENSNGHFLLPVDGDDKISDDYLSMAVPILRDNLEIKFVYCDAEYFGAKTGIWPLPDYNYKIFICINMLFCSGLFRRKDYDKTGGYKISMAKGLEDWDFLLTLIEEKDAVYKINKVCFFYRIQAGSRNSSIGSDDYRELYEQIYSNHIEIYNKNLDNQLILAVTNIKLENENIKLKKNIQTLRKERSLIIIVMKKIIRFFSRAS